MAGREARDDYRLRRRGRGGSERDVPPLRLLGAGSGARMSGGRARRWGWLGEGERGKPRILGRAIRKSEPPRQSQRGWQQEDGICPARGEQRAGVIRFAGTAGKDSAERRRATPFGSGRVTGFAGRVGEAGVHRQPDPQGRIPRSHLPAPAEQHPPYALPGAARAPHPSPLFHLVPRIAPASVSFTISLCLSSLPSSPRIGCADTTVCPTHPPTHP